MIDYVDFDWLTTITSGTTVFPAYVLTAANLTASFGNVKFPVVVKSLMNKLQPCAPATKTYCITIDLYCLCINISKADNNDTTVFTRIMFLYVFRFDVY